jgi:hypothetical protein
MKLHTNLNKDWIMYKATDHKYHLHHLACATMQEDFNNVNSLNRCLDCGGFVPTKILTKAKLLGWKMLF